MADHLTIDFDVSQVLSGITDFTTQMQQNLKTGINDVATEILRLSQSEVPHNIGLLSQSGHVEPKSNLSSSYEALVGYNKTYAARLHEHPEYRFQKGRKGKYLEDPIKNNMSVFLAHIRDALSGIF